jgi:hypothetical protein
VFSRDGLLTFLMIRGSGFSPLSRSRSLLSAFDSWRYGSEQPLHGSTRQHRDHRTTVRVTRVRMGELAGWAGHWLGWGAGQSDRRGKRCDADGVAKKETNLHAFHLFQLD